MPRLREMPLAEANEGTRAIYRALFGTRDPVAEPGTETGTRGDWWTVIANSPATLRHAAQGFAYYRDPARKLDPVLRELGQAWAGWAAGSSFVFSQHCKVLRGLGVAEEKIAALPHWQASDLFAPTERLALAYADRLVMHQGRVPDALFAQLREALSDEEIVELTYVTSLYLMHAVMSRALRTEYDDREDPVREHPAPEGFDPTSLINLGDGA